MTAGQFPYPWRFEVCKDCGRNNVVGFRVCDHIWQAVMGDEQGILCVWCFDERAAAKGIDWTECPVEWYPVSTVANRKWADVEIVGAGSSGEERGPYKLQAEGSSPSLPTIVEAS